ncbi:hypothetical protein Tco_1042366, partial [Tanacetum coccineum]
WSSIHDDDDEELTESDEDGDDFVHPKLTTHDDEIIHEEDSDEDNASISSSDDEDSDDEDEGTNVDGAKTQEEATDTEDQGNEEVKDTNTDLDGRDNFMLFNSWESYCWCSEINLLLITFNSKLEVMHSFPYHCTSNEYR